MTLLDAIAREEGFFVHGTRAARNNNPGDLEFHPWMRAFGAEGGDPRFAIFPTPEQGFAALRDLLESSEYRGLTVAEALNKFAPPNENETNVYIVRVCSWTGCKPTDLIDGLLETA